MTTPNPKNTTGSKLASSVRRAKTSPADEKASEALSETAESNAPKPAATRKTTTVRKTPVKKATAKSEPQKEAITPMPSSRVWPD